MNKFSWVLLLNLLNMHAMEQLEYASIDTKQEEEKINFAIQSQDNQTDIEQRDKHNQQLIAALDKAWELPGVKNNFFTLEKSGSDETVISTIPELQNVRILLDCEDSTRKKCWYNVIKISLMKNLLREKNNRYFSFSEDLAAYLQDQMSAKYYSDEQTDNWLQEVLRLFKNN